MNRSNEHGLTPIWVVLAGLFCIEILVRFVVGFDLQPVLLVETISFLTIGVFFYWFAGKKHRLTHRKRTVLNVSAVAFVLAAIRSGLWLSGVEVQWANGVILGLGLTAFAVWRRRRKPRSSSS